MQDDQSLSFDELKHVCLSVPKFGGGSCGINITRNNSFVQRSCSPHTSHVFLDWQFSGSRNKSYHLFGIQDPSNTNQYRLIDIDENEYLRLSSISSPPTKDMSLRSTDRPLFLMEYIIQDDKWSLQHVASKKYISVDFNNNRIIVRNLKETAVEVNISTCP